MRHRFCIAALAFVLPPIAAQIPSAPKPSFAVVSIKANKSGNRIVLPTASPGGRFSATNVWLRSLLQFAYQPRNGSLTRNQIVGGPSWMDTDQFDIEAKGEADAGVIPPEEMQLMVRSMLEHRFQLKAHVENRELPIVDKTNLRGLFDVKLQFALDAGGPSVGTQLGPPPDPSGPSFFTAVQGQLGLRLEPARGPVEVLVIDSAQKPTEN
jgi:Protein of unknown function (DUF3738)